MFLGDTIYLLFAFLMPLFFAIIVFIFIRSTKKQNEALKHREKEMMEFHKESSGK
ncbi:hypothetical protein ACQKL5_16785 [Peribacillus sp. NPDC097675]|uniref:hypothetical protein n=1 Tax=Peribacillus sp. NPDC097675 TaxID=3390618 RepID=UPI003D0280C4